MFSIVMGVLMEVPNNCYAGCVLRLIKNEPPSLCFIIEIYVYKWVTKIVTTAVISLSLTHCLSLAPLSFSGSPFVVNVHGDYV